MTRNFIIGLLALATLPAFANIILPNEHTINPIGIGTCANQASIESTGECLAPMTSSNNPEATCGYRRLTDNPLYYFQDCTPNYTTVNNAPSDHGPILVVYPVPNTGSNVATQPLMLATCLVVPGRNASLDIPAVTEFGTDDARKFLIAPCTNIGEIPLLQEADRGPNSHALIYTCITAVPEAGIPSSEPLSRLNAYSIPFTRPSTYTECPAA